MSKVVSYKPKKWELIPEGPVQAVIESVTFIDNVATEYGVKDKVRIRFEVEQLDSESGKPLSTLASFNRSLHENATLRKKLKQIMGTDVGEEFDLDTLVGKNVMLMIEHSNYKGKDYANISAFAKVKPGTPLLTPSKAAGSAVRELSPAVIPDGEDLPTEEDDQQIPF